MAEISFWALRWIGVLLALGLGGCATLEINTDYDPEADFSSLRSYAWVPVTESRTRDSTVDYSSLMEARVHRAVDENLAGKAFSLDGEDPDFLVAFYVTIDKKVSVTYINDLYGYQWGGWYHRRYRRPGGVRGEALVSEYDEGTLLIDVIDPRTRQLMWRGSARDEVYFGDSPQVREQRIRDAVNGVLEHFPPSQ